MKKEVPAENVTKKEAEVPNDTFNAALEAVRLMKKKQQEGLVQDRVMFAGQSYSVERAATGRDLKKQEAQEKRKLGGKCEALDELVGLISAENKNVNCIEKSKIDWDQYAKEEKIEEQLEQNRKDGFLAKKRFLD